MDAIFANKLKSMLTALGIIFGVAAVISMLAIGNGAKQEILELIKLVGVNNIVVRPISSEDKEKMEDEQGDSRKESGKFSRGLTLQDAESIMHVLPTVLNVSPEVTEKLPVIANGIQKNLKVNGVAPCYFELFHLVPSKGGTISQYHNEYGKSVCVIGSEVKSMLFGGADAIGKKIKCGSVWFTIIGVLEKRSGSSSTTEELGLINADKSIYIPVKTFIMRIKNRSLITARNFSSGGGGEDFFYSSSGEEVDENHNQLDKIVIQVENTEELKATTEVIKRMLLRRHSEVEDFEIIVPELLLKQQQETKDIFNIVLVAIASISLIVGGIGIMNIMLASVMERIKEIGTRLAIGATKTDIIVQFLAESTIISLTGGFFGIVLGVVISKLLTHFQGILTVISLESILVAFSISVFVGILFGYMPAKRAAQRDPVESLRYE